MIKKFFSNFSFNNKKKLLFISLPQAGTDIVSAIIDAHPHTVYYKKQFYEISIHSTQKYSQVNLDHSTPTLYIFRRNQLQQTFFKLYTKQIQKHNKINVNCKTIHDHMITNEITEIKFFSKLHFPYLCPIAYEDLISNLDYELKRINQFLGVKDFTVRTIFKKIEPPLYSELIINYDEFHNYFSKTPYQYWLNHGTL